LLAGVILVALASGACTRSASTPPATSETGAKTTGVASSQEATMAAVRALLLTQTAQATSGPTQPATLTPVSALTTGTPAPGVTLVAATKTPTGPTTYVVQTGDWVYSIARKFNVDPYAIINLNNLAYPYSLSVGQSLKIPGGGSTPAPITSTPGGPTVTPGGPTATGQTYVVQEGEWVYSIARKFGVDPQAIIDANNLQPPYVLHPGDTLIIP
jgi:LysM repeat protein